MIEYTPYMLVTMLSSVIILVMGVCLLFVSAPKGPELKNYRISRRFLAVAYILLSAVGQWEIWGSGEDDGTTAVMAFTLISASFQALLFTFSIITLINMRYMTARRVWVNVIPISLSSVGLLVVLFAAPEHFFLPVFYSMLGLYCLKLIYYVVLFVREYDRYRRRFDNFFSGDEYRRLRWGRDAFYMAAGVGMIAIASIFVSTEIYMAFTAAYTVFYVYFAVKFISYVSLFYYIEPAVAEPQDNKAVCGKEIPFDHIREGIDLWLANRGFLDSEVTMAALARELNTNSAYLSRYINSEYGQNFRSWINSQRISEAQKLIAENDKLSLAEVGDQIGIPSSSTFYRHFATVTGMSPAEYRKRFGRKQGESDEACSGE